MEIGGRSGGGGGDCCVGIYDRGRGAESEIGRIMLRFHLIAPKPPAATTGLPAATQFTVGRARGGSVRKPKRNSFSSDNVSARGKTRKVVKTASPAPSASSPSSLSAGPPSSPSSVLSHAPPPPLWLLHSSPMSLVQPSESLVTVEYVTDTWCDGDVQTEAIVDAVSKTLENYAGCPGFITDQCDRVTWTNKAYRRMVVGPPPEVVEEGEAVMAGLVTRGIVPAAGTCRVFACRVHVKYASRRRGKGWLAAPCDVWRLEDGSCVWRIDTTTALSLRSNIL